MSMRDNTSSTGNTDNARNGNIQGGGGGGWSGGGGGFGGGNWGPTQFGGLARTNYNSGPMIKAGDNPSQFRGQPGMSANDFFNAIGAIRAPLGGMGQMGGGGHPGPAGQPLLGAPPPIRPPNILPPNVLPPDVPPPIRPPEFPPLPGDSWPGMNVSNPPYRPPTGNEWWPGFDMQGMGGMNRGLGHW